MRLSLAILAALALALLAHDARDTARELDRPRTFARSGYVGSGQCLRCHAQHGASFRRTYHATMTQEASAASVLAPFDGSELEYMGVRARMQRGPRGEYRMTFDDGRTHWQADVARTVGSHRYQQFLAREAGVYFRLPIAWDVARARFIHMNTAFLTADPPRPNPSQAIARSDYDRHVTRWNDNCVFCHNVHPNPGLDPVTGRFETRVAELGVACEACHGPGGEHVARNADPLRRYALHLSGRADPTITNPRRVAPARSAEICGRCHGQRITSDVSRFLVHGDSFVPGEPLSKFSKPLARDTTLHGQSGAFAARFWNDGTPRLTAYEYQGYLQSACTSGGKLECESCHAMHAGDPAGQIRPELAGDRMCTQCHRELTAPGAIAAHTHHSASSNGSRCGACHMPNLVYGLASVHLSHRIETPDPAANAASGRPDACTSCHVDRTRSWAADALSRWLKRESSTSANDAHTELPALTEQLLAGDPIVRAVAADAFGRNTAAFAPGHRARIVGLLQDTLDHDPYPAVRELAARSLAAVIGRGGPIAPSALAPELAQTLRARAAQAAIEIGE